MKINDFKSELLVNLTGKWFDEVYGGTGEFPTKDEVDGALS